LSECPGSVGNALPGGRADLLQVRGGQFGLKPETPVRDQTGGWEVFVEPIILAESAMSLCTGPAVAFRAGDDPSSDRVSLDVTDSLPEMGVIQDTSEEAFLPEMATEPVLTIEVVSIEAMQIMQTLGKCAARVRHRNQVYVIGHETVGIEANGVFSHVLAQFAQIETIIRLLTENVETSVAAMSDMMRQAGKNQTAASGHGSSPLGWKSGVERIDM
jgi:hypothetical protein